MEKANLQRAYKSLAKQSVTIFNKKLGYVMLEQFLMKYGWAGTGMITMAIPIFTSREDSASVGDNIAGKAFEMITLGCQINEYTRLSFSPFFTLLYEQVFHPTHLLDAIFWIFILFLHPTPLLGPTCLINLHKIPTLLVYLALLLGA